MSRRDLKNCERMKCKLEDIMELAPYDEVAEDD